VTPEELAAEQDARDRALLSAHLGGDPQAFDTLVRLHQQRMWAVALRTLRDPDEAADAVQDACLSAFRGAATYRGDARVSTWLHRIVVNACLDRARRRSVRPTVPLPEQPPADPRDRLAERETGLDVEKALATLPDEQRVALVLVELEGLSVAEAAELLQVPEGTVKSRCFRGRARLALQLGHLRNPDAPPPVPPVTPTAEGGHT
jgi:RNA polymerase sigma-70 factor (ECF subfamily)